MYRYDISGKTYNRLTVIRKIGVNRSRAVVWECLCVCGNKSNVTGTALRRGSTKSCGCIKHEYYPNHFVKHGKFGTKIYRTWGGIKFRCENPNSKAYPGYGGRGIKMYEPWSKSFVEFYKYIGDPPTDKHTLDRIDNNKGYEPGNIQWATWKQQANNRRDTVIIEYKGQKMSISEWARLRNIKINTLNARIQRSKWPIGKALGYE